MDCVAPPRINPSVTASRFLVAKGDFRTGRRLEVVRVATRERRIGGEHSVVLQQAMTSSEERTSA